MLRVLAIDGGGIRGIIPAMLLVELEKATGRQVFELFDLIAGTSTGGILALGLTCPQRDGRPKLASAMRDLYLCQAEQIFPLGGVPTVGRPKNAWLGDRAPLKANPSLTDRFKHFMGYENIAKTFAPTGGGRGGQGNARYPAEPLEEHLRSEVGEVLLSQAVRPVVVVSCDLARQEPLLFCGGGLNQAQMGDVPMWKAARATSAGPTFFPAIGVRDVGGVVRECVDGGLVANDPAFVAYTEALSLLVSRGRSNDEVLLVSLGTGMAPKGEPPEVDDVAQLIDRRSWLTLAPQLLGAMSSSGGELMRQQLSQVLGARYVRFQTQLQFGAVHAMDDIRSENLERLRLTGEQMVQASAPALERLVPLLTR